MNQPIVVTGGSGTLGRAVVARRWTAGMRFGCSAAPRSRRPSWVVTMTAAVRQVDRSAGTVGYRDSTGEGPVVVLLGGISA